MMPRWLEDLKTDFGTKEDCIAFFQHPAGDSLKNGFYYIAGTLAFKKAYNLQLLDECRHFEAQYKLFLLSMRVNIVKSTSFGKVMCCWAAIARHTGI